MCKFIRVPIVVEAHQWFKNGDIPSDDSTPISQENPELREGNIVRYYRTPALDGQNKCKKCNKKMHAHGWIDEPKGGYIVCPGDWVIKNTEGEYKPISNKLFHSLYQKIDV